MNMDPAALDRHITGNWGEDFMREQGDEYDPPCDHCGLALEFHREEQQEGKYGHDYEGIVCPPEDVRDNEKALAHWVKTGCYDLMPVFGNVTEVMYCYGCGQDLSDDVLEIMVAEAEARDERNQWKAGCG